MNNNKMIKTMKSKSIIGAVLAAIFTIGFTTSCEDMFNIESSRVIYEHNHDLGSTADSASVCLGSNPSSAARKKHICKADVLFSVIFAHICRANVCEFYALRA